MVIIALYKAVRVTEFFLISSLVNSVYIRRVDTVLLCETEKAERVDYPNSLNTGKSKAESILTGVREEW